ncbi:hypothetical protein WN944_009394 [Citrus x changshan-huyou]|uniref:Uncharacterized protein n=1 Tax=Citrus x changshan-huyou TaxID=2935761 RepID=A0AAP0MS48_9ROSI
MDDIKMLADSVRSKFETLHPLSNGCCIYRVPQGWRCLHPNDYTPKMVSIGPLHHGNEELKAMEEHKLRYLRCFLQRTNVSIEYFLTFIKVKEAELRNCYAETIAFNSDDFATMIFVDAIFLLEFFLRGFRRDFTTSDDRIYGKPRLIDQLIDDLWLLENQLPLFILNELFDLAKAATYGDYYEGLSLFRISRWFWGCGFTKFPIDKDLCQIMPGAKELHQSGVKFNVGTSKNPFDITFDKGIIKIPFVTIYDDTESFYRNVLAFERMHGYTRYLNDYIIIMSYLAHTPEDGKLLIQNGIVGLGNSERLSNFFLSLIKECPMGRGFGYTNLVEDLQSYCKSPWHSWKANLRQNYFNTPWASISVAGAVILLVLTLVQTACSVIGL